MGDYLQCGMSSSMPFLPVLDLNDVVIDTETLFKELLVEVPVSAFDELFGGIK